jgi:carbon storage regulator
MLVLGRKPGEEIQVGPNIRITVIKSDRRSVRIGVEAPASIPVNRAELLRPTRRAAASRRSVRPVRSVA